MLCEINWYWYFGFDDDVVFNCYVDWLVIVFVGLLGIGYFVGYLSFVYLYYVSD